MKLHVQEREAVEKTLSKIVNDETCFIGKSTRIDTIAAANESGSLLGKRKNKDALFNAKEQCKRPQKRMRASDFVPQKKQLSRLDWLLPQTNKATTFDQLVTRLGAAQRGIPIRRQHCQIMMNVRNEALYI